MIITSRVYWRCCKRCELTKILVRTKLANPGKSRLVTKSLSYYQLKEISLNLNAWVGPFTVIKKVTPDYQVKMPGRRQEERVYHINLLKTWNPGTREATAAHLALYKADELTGEESRPDMAEATKNMGKIAPSKMKWDELYPYATLEQPTEGSTPKLGESQRLQLRELAQQFPKSFSRVPNRQTL